MPRRGADLVQQALERIARIQGELTELDYVSSGTLLKRMKLCGNSNCRCHRDPDGRHGPYYQWDHMKAGRLVHRNVSPEQAVILRRGIANYRKAKKLIKAWEDETERLMDNLKPARKG